MMSIAIKNLKRLWFSIPLTYQCELVNVLDFEKAKMQYIYKELNFALFVNKYAIKM